VHIVNSSERVSALGARLIVPPPAAVRGIDRGDKSGRPAPGPEAGHALNRGGIRGPAGAMLARTARHPHQPPTDLGRVHGHPHDEVGIALACNTRSTTTTGQIKGPIVPMSSVTPHRFTATRQKESRRALAHAKGHISPPFQPRERHRPAHVCQT